MTPNLAVPTDRTRAKVVSIFSGDPPSWISAWVKDEHSAEMLTEMQRMHAQLSAELPTDDVGIQDILTSRVQATVLADYYLAQAATSKGGLASNRGVELAKLAVQLRSIAAKHAETIIKLYREYAEVRKQKAAESQGDTRAVFTKADP